jgi:hypothetical protein
MDRVRWQKHRFLRQWISHSINPVVDFNQRSDVVSFPGHVQLFVIIESPVGPFLFDLLRSPDRGCINVYCTS